MEKVRLEDVAEHAGVSPTTVSRVLNNRGAISDKTRKKVNDAIEELGYFPNEIARSLYGNKTNIIGVLFPNVSNPFYGEMVTELETILSEKGYKVLICNTNNNPEKEAKYLKMLLSNQVDGVIVGSRNLPSDIYQKAHLPIVAIDRVLSEKVPIIRSDNYQGACMATEYLIDKKCKKIALFTGSPEEEIMRGDQRIKGYIDTLEKQDYDPLILQVSFDEDEAFQRKRVAEYLDAYPDIDGAFATGDTLAGILNTVASSRGNQIKIVGYDGTDTFLKFCGNISTIRQPIKEMAQVAIDVMSGIFAGDYHHQDNQEFILPVTLIESIY
ncbi:MAG: LacI family transcriptional regulator [Turicibacter sp.]|nr:LacI family transcriptional regulator [Turicibacter sp.]